MDGLGVLHGDRWVYIVALHQRAGERSFSLGLHRSARYHLGDVVQ